MGSFLSAEKENNQSKDESEIEIKEISSDQNDFHSLVNDAFHISKEADFFNDFLIWNENSKETKILGLYNKEGLCSVAGAHVDFLKINDKEIKIGILGAVATASCAQKRGYASLLLDQQIEWLRAEGALAIFLWGGEQAIYSDRGFALCGLQLSAKLSDIEFSDAVKNGLSPVRLQEGWDDRIYDIVKKRNCGLNVKSKNFYSAHKNVQWVSLCGVDGSIQAYLAYNRGIDLINHIHEWGANNIIYMHKLFYLMSLQSSHLKLIGHADLFKKYQLQSSTFNYEYLALSKIIDPQKLAGLIGLKELNFKEKDKNWVVSSKFGQGEVLIDQKQLAKLFFGPEDAEGMSTPISDLPLSIWFWGLDSA